MAVSQTQTPTISVIVLNYQTPELTLDLISALGLNDEIEIILIDNSPEDNISKRLPKYVRYFFMNENLGFAGGVNKGIEKARGEWIMLLNSDTQTSSKDILNLVALTKKNEKLVAAPKLINNNKVENNVGYFDTFQKNPLNALFARPRFVDCAKVREPLRVNLATGGALLIHKSVFEQVGVFDKKSFFMYFEDIDFSMRLYNNDIPVLYLPNVQIHHKSGGTADKDPGKKRHYYQVSLNNYVIKQRGSIISTLNNILHVLK